jgi:hypothetical protein
MRGNSHVRFLGGKGAATPLTYPIVYPLTRISHYIYELKDPLSPEEQPQ